MGLRTSTRQKHAGRPAGGPEAGGGGLPKMDTWQSPDTLECGGLGTGKMGVGRPGEAADSKGEVSRATLGGPRTAGAGFGTRA